MNFPRCVVVACLFVCLFSKTVHSWVGWMPFCLICPIHLSSNTHFDTCKNSQMKVIRLEAHYSLARLMLSFTNRVIK